MADVVLGLWNPAKLDMTECLGYDVEDDMIGLKIIKNRLSTDNIAIMLKVDPKSGSFTELPKLEKKTKENKSKYSTN